MARPPGGYRLRDGTPVVGVTTILGKFKDPGGLNQWAYKTGRMHENLAWRGEKDPGSLFAVVDGAALIGNTAHDMVEGHILGRTRDDVIEVLEALDGDGQVNAVSAYNAYSRWGRSTNMQIILTEVPLVSHEYEFGGTFDAIAIIDGKLCLLDWKTSNGVYADYLVQIAAYGILLRENADYLNKLCEERGIDFRSDTWEVEGYHLLRFSKEHADFKHHSWVNLSEAEECFIHLRRCYTIMEGLKKRAK